VDGQRSHEAAIHCDFLKYVARNAIKHTRRTVEIPRGKLNFFLAVAAATYRDVTLHTAQDLQSSVDVDISEHLEGNALQRLRMEIVSRQLGRPFVVVHSPNRLVEVVHDAAVSVMGEPIGLVYDGANHFNLLRL